MSFRPIIVCCVAVAVVWAGSVGKAKPVAKDDPAENSKDFTAFPELKVPLQEAVRGRPDYDKLIARLDAGRAAIARRTPEDAPPLQKIRLAQLTQGIAYLKKVIEVISIGRFNDEEFKGMMEMCVKVHHMGANLSEDAAVKVKWLEDGVVMLKFIEYYAYSRVDAGNAPPQTLSLARFYRLQAEEDLIRLKEQTENAKKK